MLEEFSARDHFAHPKVRGTFIGSNRPERLPLLRRPDVAWVSFLMAKIFDLPEWWQYMNAYAKLPSSEPGHRCP